MRGQRLRILLSNVDACWKITSTWPIRQMQLLLFLFHHHHFRMDQQALREVGEGRRWTTCFVLPMIQRWFQSLKLTQFISSLAYAHLCNNSSKVNLKIQMNHGCSSQRLPLSITTRLRFVCCRLVGHGPEFSPSAVSALVFLRLLRLLQLNWTRGYRTQEDLEMGVGSRVRTAMAL